MKRIISILSAVAAFACLWACTPDETVYETAPAAKFDVSATTVERGVTVNFTDRSVPIDGVKLVAWDWNFDFENKENTSEVSKEQNPSYAFKAEGTYTVRLVVTDSQGRFASATETITIETPYRELAHAAFELPADKVNINQEVQFTDNSQPAEGATITKWEWNFGESNESVSTEQNPKWTYTSSGNFTVKLTVTDSKNNTSSVSHDIMVMDPNDMVKLLWKSAVTGAIQNTVSPAMSPDGSTVYMWADQSATDAYDVQLMAFNVADGTLKWAFNASNALAELNDNGGVRQIFASPAVGPNGDIYICARDLKNTGAARKSFCFAITPDGKKRWHYAFGIDSNFNYMTPAIDAAGNIYLGHLTTQPFEIAIINPENGSKTKSIPLTLGVRSGISVDKAGNVYFCSTGTNGLFSYSSASAAMNWNYKENVATTGGDITIGADGTVYTVIAGAQNGIVAAVSSNGAKKWEYELPGGADYGGAVIGADGTIYANGGKVSPAKDSGGIVALNSDGSLKWHFPTDEDVNNCVPLVDNRGYVHFITDKGTYYVVTNEGTLYGTKSLGTKTFASPVINAKGEVCIAVEEDGKSFVCGLDTGAEGYADSAWPMKGQNPQRTHAQK